MSNKYIDTATQNALSWLASYTEAIKKKQAFEPNPDMMKIALLAYKKHINEMTEEEREELEEFRTVKSELMQKGVL